MGANMSIKPMDVFETTVLMSHIVEYNEGIMQRKTSHYKIFLMMGRIIIDDEYFYTNVDIENVSQYINDLGPLKDKEVVKIVRMIIKSSKSNSEAQEKLRKILPKVHVPINKHDKSRCTSPLYSKKYYKRYILNYIGPWGKPFVPEKIDFNSKEIKSKREKLEKKRVKYVKHTVNSAFLVFRNSFYELEHMELSLKPLNFKRKPKRPKKWREDIKKAAYAGDIKSVAYCLHLLPDLLNCPEKNGNTPMHYAAKGGQHKVIYFLHSLGGDVFKENKEGFQPVHMSSNNKVVLALTSLGCDLNSRNAAGESLLEIKTKNFDKNIVELILKSGFDIFEPNPKGIYWMQFAVNNQYYGEMGLVKFHEFVRNIIRKNRKAPYHDNPVLKEVLKRKVKDCEKEDKEDIDRAIKNKDVERVKSLLALGARANLPRKDNKPNIMYCAEKNIADIAGILAYNYCDPNTTNEKGENTFWVAANLGNNETALALRDHGASMNWVSNAGITILHMAYAERITRKKLFNFLLEAGASPNAKNSNGESVLYISYDTRDDATAEMLQDKYKGDINTLNKKGHTLAHAALLNKDIDRMDYYISRKYDLETKDLSGYTLLRYYISLFDEEMLPIAKKLLGYGANINTKDSKGNTPLVAVCKDEKFSRVKFDFILENKCYINELNLIRETAISVLLERGFDDEVNILLGKRAIINDSDSEYEPIVIALKHNSQYWVERLLDYGANALNSMFPVLVAYMNTNFFDLERVKKMSGWNLCIGGPFQVAMRMKRLDVCDFIWEIAHDNVKICISKSRDSLGMTPLSVALNFGNDKYIKAFIKHDYDVVTPDNNRMTPLIHACKLNNWYAMDNIWKLIKTDLSSINKVDVYGYSALSYAAENKQRDFCNKMFIAGVNVYNIKKDLGGIIFSYQKLIEKHEYLVQKCKRNLKEAEDLYERTKSIRERFDETKDELESDLSKLKSRKRDLEWQNEKHFYDYEISSVRSKIYSKEHEIRMITNKICEAMSSEIEAMKIVTKYINIFKEVEDASRSDLLYRMDYLERLAST